MSAGALIGLLVATSGLGVGVRALAIRHDERGRARRLLRRCAPLDAGAAAEGARVWAAGIVRPLDDTLIAPLSGRPCVAYRASVLASAIPREWRVTAQVRPFVLDLGDEELLVGGDAALFGLPPSKLDARDPEHAERAAAFRARHALDRSSTTFHEVALELGAPAVVGGTLVLVPRDEPVLDAELGFRDAPPPSQRLVGNRAHPLLFSDRIVGAR